MTDLLTPIFDRLDQLENLILAQEKPSHWLDLKAAAKYTDLSSSTLKRAVNKGLLKVAKGTGKMLFKPAWLDQYLILGHCRRLTPFEKNSIGL